MTSSVPALDASVFYSNSTTDTDNSSYISSQLPAAKATRPTDDFVATVAIVIPVIFALIIVFGLVGNVLVIAVVAINKHMRNPTNTLLVNLAIADLSFLLVCVPFTAFKYTTPLWIFGDVWCKIYSYMTYVCAWASVYTLVLLCVDRMLAVVFAIQLPNVRSRRNYCIALVILWLVVLLANIPAILFHGEFKYPYRDGSYRKTCVFLYHMLDEDSTYTFHVCFFLFGFTLPIVAIIIMYTVLVVFIARKNGPEGHRSKGMTKTKRKVTVMVIAVVSAFIVCWLPIQIILLMGTFDLYGKTKDHVTIQIAANCLAYMNSCMNPVLYSLASTMFRKEFVQLLRCKTCLAKCKQRKELNDLPPSIKSKANSKRKSKDESRRASGEEATPASKPIQLDTSNDTAETRIEAKPLLGLTESVSNNSSSNGEKSFIYS